MSYCLKNIDALIGMAELPDTSIDCIITDPPYPTISGGHGGVNSASDANRPSGMLSKNDGKIFAENDLDISQWIGECYRVLKPDTHIYVMTNFLNLQHYMEEMEKAGFVLHNLLIWEKNNATPNRWYMKSCEYIIFARKGQAKPINFCGSKTVLHFDNVKDKIHPTEKPVDLLRLLIENSTKKGQTVLDPFGGSFSTAFAALQCERNVVSFELDEEYYNAGMKRIEGFSESDICTTEKEAPSLTAVQQTVMNTLNAHPNQLYSAQELSELTGLSRQTCSGCFGPLYSAGLIEKSEDKPVKVKITKY